MKKVLETIGIFSIDKRAIFAMINEESSYSNSFELKKNDSLNNLRIEPNDLW